MGFNSAFKGLMQLCCLFCRLYFKSSALSWQRVLCASRLSFVDTFQFYFLLWNFFIPLCKESCIWC